MSAPAGMTVIAVLAAVLLVVGWSLWRTIRHPLAPMEDIEDIVGGHKHGEYQALARQDGIHPDVADAFEQEVKIRGHEMRRKDQERRKRDAGDGSAGFDLDPS